MEERCMTCRKARASCDYLFLNRGRLSEEWVFDCCPLLAREHYYKISARVESMLYENRDMFVADLGELSKDVKKLCEMHEMSTAQQGMIISRVESTIGAFDRLEHNPKLPEESFAITQLFNEPIEASLSSSNITFDTYLILKSVFEHGAKMGRMLSAGEGMASRQRLANSFHSLSDGSSSEQQTSSLSSSLLVGRDGQRRGNGVTGGSRSSSSSGSHEILSRAPKRKRRKVASTQRSRLKSAGRRKVVVDPMIGDDEDISDREDDADNCNGEVCEAVAPLPIKVQPNKKTHSALPGCVVGVSYLSDGCYIASARISGRMVSLGVHGSEEAAARAHDLALIRAVGPEKVEEGDLNSPIESYAVEPLQAFADWDAILKKQLSYSGWSGGQLCDFSFLLRK